ncbi:MAG: TraC family protein [Oligoflexales bacterium]
MKAIENVLRNRNVFTEALLKRPESLGSLLPYEEYLDDLGIFQLKDGSLGAVFKVELLEHESMTEDQVLRSVSSLRQWFSLPENCALQVLFDSSRYSPLDNKIQELKDNFEDPHPVSKALFDEKLRLIQKDCLETSETSPLQRQLLISIRYFLAKPFKVKLNELSKSNASISRELKDFKNELHRFDHILKDFKENNDISVKQLGGEEFARIIRRQFNPESYYKRDFAPLNKNVAISDQLIFSTPKLNYEGIECEGHKTRVLTIKTAPCHSYPGGMAYFVDLNFPFRISINYSFPRYQDVKKFLGMKEFFLENAATAKAKVQKAEIDEVQYKLALDDRVLHMTFCIIIDGKTDEELDDKTRKICHICHSHLECEVISETDIGLGLWMNGLPLGYTPDADLSTRRAIRILRSDAINFIPVFDSFRGLKKPVGLHLSRENNLVPFSLLENETSNHTVVLADTGSGKSAFVVDWLQSAKKLSPEPIVFIIDKKSSYGMLSQYYDGDLTVFKRDQKIPFSPFRGIYNEEKIAFLTKMISMALKLTSPSFSVESEHHTLVSKALKLAYLKKLDRHGLDYIEGEFIKQKDNTPVTIDMNDFIVELGSLVQGKNENERSIIETLVSKLKPFYGDGTYAAFFTAGQSSSLNSDTLFYVYDLDALDSDPTLQTLMTMAVIEEIRCILSLPQHAGRTGFLVMEEFAMLGRNNPAFSDFAIDFAETMRKRGCWLITLTPRPQNYFDLEVGKAFWGVADNFIFLQMSSDNVDYIAKKSSLLNEANNEIIRSLRTKKGLYADIYYLNKSKSIAGAFRYRQTSYDRWMCPTNAIDTAKVINAFEKHSNKWAALKFLVSHEQA